jgi:alkaline phosphatase D
MRRSTRRELIGAAAAGAAGLAVPRAWGRQLSGRAGVGLGRFRDGVASGEPGPTAVTFWSRLTTDYPRSGARLVIARDEHLRHVVATRVVPTGRGINGTLKARVGGLKPSSEYFYVWESGDDTSPVGRTLTRPHPSSNQPLRLMFSSCQNYPVGFFSPHAHAATEEIDLCVFLGDYIYAEARSPSPLDFRRDRIMGNDLRSYRRKYELYRGDAGLRELHRVHPAVHIWDDHELANNYTDNRPTPAPLQRAAAYRAAFEWLPRIVFPRERARIYKQMRLGRTADLFLLDERQYRTGRNDGQPRRMLGDRQKAWLVGALRASAARWKIVANQVAIAPMDYGSGPGADGWATFPDGTELLGEIERAGIDNVVFLTGDAHVFMLNLLASDAEVFADDPAHRPAAIEYVAGSITSPGADRLESSVQANNPWNRLYNGHEHGYAHLTLDTNELVTEYRRSDISRPGGATATFERFTQPAGENAVSRQSLPVARRR